MTVNEPDREFPYRREDFDAIRQRLYQVAGISMSDSKQQLVYSRISRRLRALGLASFADYLMYLRHHGEEQQEFVNALTTNLTAFFRESHHFDLLKRYLQANAAPGHRFRLWCAASSTGEEPYSMAIAALEALGEAPPVTILATDIDSRVLAVAAAGIYDLERVRDISRERLKRFFLKGTGGQTGRVKVRRQLRELVEFRSLNLLAPQWSLKPGFDLIFCRNVMIYFDKPTQARLLDRMLGLLSPEGLYIAGHSESFAHMSDRVRLVDKTTYRAVPMAGREVRA